MAVSKHAEEEGIELERGLITHVFNGIDVYRIQSVHIHQTFFQRLMRCCSVSYGRVGVATGEESSGSSSQLETDRLVVHPFLPIAEAWGVVQGLTPNTLMLPWRALLCRKWPCVVPLPEGRCLKGVGFWLTVALLLLCAAAFAADATAAQGHAQLGDFAAATLIPGLLLCVAIAAIEVVGAFLWHRRSAFGFDNSGNYRGKRRLLHRYGNCASEENAVRLPSCKSFAAPRWRCNRLGAYCSRRSRLR